MWIEGRRRGGASDLARHLQKTDENESVAVRQLEGFALDSLTGKSLEQAIKQMEAVGYGKGDKRNLYHAILAPAPGETLSASQQKQMVEHYAKRMGFKDHQYALVEHWKHGKQHFHLVFNIISPITGKTHELKWTKLREWDIARELEQMFNLSIPRPKGKSAKTKETQRGKRNGIDPSQMRKEVTAIFHASKTTAAFITALDKAGYALTRGQRGQLVLVDRFGDTHGLMRRIEGQKLADLRRKFPGIEQMELPSHTEIIKTRKSVNDTQCPTRQQHSWVQKYIDPENVRNDVQRAYRTSKTGASFVSILNKQGYRFGHGVKGLALIDGNGDRHDFGREPNQKYPDLETLGIRPASEVIRRLKTKRLLGSKPEVASIIPPSPSGKKLPTPLVNSAQPTTASDRRMRQSLPRLRTNGWPEAAIIDWAAWGHRNVGRFFSKWPELAPDGFRPFSGGPSH